MVHSLTHDELNEKYEERVKSEIEIVNLLGLLAFNVGRVEHQLSRILCHILGFKNFENFGVISFSISTKETLNYIFKIAKLRKSPVGKNLKKILKHFDEKIIPMRNELIHNHVFKDNEYLVCMKVDKVPGAHDDEIWPNKIPPTRYEISEVKRKILWLEDFHKDLFEVGNKTWNGIDIEIDNPSSSLP